MDGKKITRGDTSPGRNAAGGKRRVRVLLVLIVAVAALAVALPLSLHELHSLRALQRIETRLETQIEKNAALEAALTDEALRADGWIQASFVREVADRFGLGTEVMSRMFPDKIVYKEGGETRYADIDPSLPRNGYDWDGRLTWRDGRPVYVAEDGARSALGVDVSHHQKKIDWARVAADGIDFAMIRVGYRGAEQGTLKEDTFFRDNITGAAVAGVSVGAYFFSQATSEAEAVQEADYVIDALSGAAVTMPVVFDMEEVAGAESRVEGLSPERVTSCARAFCDRVSEAGYMPAIYANTRWFVARMNLADLSDYGKWLAQYFESPAYPYEFAIWQYTNTGRVDGIEGDVDMNLALPAG
jgi:GH25 family lysozyme M1 (1,4-beta-N-acetylmuramidase)